MQKPGNPPLNLAKVVNHNEPFCCVAIGQAYYEHPQLFNGFLAANWLVVLTAAIALLTRLSYRWYPATTQAASEQQASNNGLTTTDFDKIATRFLDPEDVYFNPSDPSQYAAIRSALWERFEAGDTNQMRAISELFGINSPCSRKNSPYEYARQLFKQTLTEFQKNDAV